MPRKPRGSRSTALMSLAGINFSGISDDELRVLFAEVLEQRIHGLSFSAYTQGQAPGTELSEDQIRQRLSIIAPSVNWIRSFSCTEGNQAIPRIAHEMGLKTLVGAWLDEDRDNNERELENVIEVARAGNADIVAVGNEVLLRDEMSEAELIDYMNRVKSAVPGVEVGYVDAYFKFVDHPRVTDCCDVILANCYPFWEGCSAEYSLLYMKDMYARAIRAGGGKRVIISETGWPNIGSPTGNAAPSEMNAIRYFLNTCQWSQEEGIEFFYFSSFDEAWKVADEGDVGAYWGLWTAEGELKYAPNG